MRSAHRVIYFSCSSAKRLPSRRTPRSRARIARPHAGARPFARRWTSPSTSSAFRRLSIPRSDISSCKCPRSALSTNCASSRVAARACRWKRRDCTTRVKCTPTPRLWASFVATGPPTRSRWRSCPIPQPNGKRWTKSFDDFERPPSRDTTVRARRDRRGTRPRAIKALRDEVRSHERRIHRGWVISGAFASSPSAARRRARGRRNLPRARVRCTRPRARRAVMAPTIHRRRRPRAVARGRKRRPTRAVE